MAKNIRIFSDFLDITMSTNKLNLLVKEQTVYRLLREDGVLMLHVVYAAAKVSFFCKQFKA